MTTYRTARPAHYPGKCDPGSMSALTCKVCAPYYRAELEQLKANDAARIAKYGRKSCADCGKVYRVDEQGIVEDHAAVCRPLAADQVMGL